MECGPRCWRNKYRREMRWALGLCLVEARWPDSRKVGEEKRAVDVHDVVYAPVQCEFDAVTVVNLVGNAVVDDVVHAVAAPHDISVVVPDERPTSVQNHFYSCKVQVWSDRHLAMEREW